MPEGPDKQPELLSPREPTPYRVINPLAETPTLLVCDHASSRFPEALGDMGGELVAASCVGPELGEQVLVDQRRVGAPGAARDPGRSDGCAAELVMP